MSDESKKTVKEPDFEKLAKTGAPSAFNKIVTIILVAICVVLAAFIIYLALRRACAIFVRVPDSGQKRAAAIRTSLALAACFSGWTRRASPR